MALTSSSTIAGGSNVFNPNKKKKVTPFDAFFAGADTGSKEAAFGGFLAAGGKVPTGTDTGLDYSNLPGALKDGEALIKGLEASGNTSSASGDVHTEKPVAKVTLLPDDATAGGQNANGPGGASATESAEDRHARLVGQYGGGTAGTGPNRSLMGSREEVRGDRLFMVSQYSDGTEEARDIGAANIANVNTPGRPTPPPSVAAPVAAPVATSNPAIEALQQSAQAIDLPSNDELRANQMAQQAAFVTQADAAGLEAANGLNLQDLTQSTVPERTLSPLEQMLESRSLERLGTDQFIDPESQAITDAENFSRNRLNQTDPILNTDSDLSRAAERFSLDRLNQEGPLLDTDSELSRRAETFALGRLGNTNLLGTDPSGLAKASEAALLQRLQGGESPQAQLRRQQFEQRLEDSERDDMELLNRLGVLRSGDSIEALTERNTRRDEGELGLAAFDEQLRDQAIGQSLDFVQRGDNVRANEQTLQRGALADVNNLQGRRDSLGLANEDLRQQAFQNVSGLQSRRDDLGLANEDLKQQAFQNTVGLQGRRDDISRDNQNLQRAALADSANVVNARNNLDLNEANITGSLRGGATQAARQAQADQEFRRAAFQQDVTDRSLSRLRGTQDVGQRERFEEDTRARLNAEDLARRADTRAGQALESDLFGQVAQGINGAPRSTLSGRSADRADDAFDLNELLSRAGLTGMLDGQRTLAGDAGSRAERGLQSDLLTGVSNRNLARNADTRAGAADLRAERGLTDDLKTSSVNRDVARDSNRRAEQTLEDLLFGTFTDQSGTRTTQNQLDRLLNRDVAQDSIDRGALADSRSERGLQSDLLSAVQSRLSQRGSDARADQTLEDLLFGTADGRRTESGLTNDVNRTNATNADRRADMTLEDLLFGTSTQRTQGGDVTRDTLRGEQNDRTDRGFEDDLLTSGLGRDATRAGLTGDFEGDRTLTAEQVDRNMANERIVQLLAAVEAGTIQGDAATNAIKELLGMGEGNSDPKGNFPQGSEATDDPNVRRGADGRTFIFKDGQWEDLGIQ